MASGFLLVLLLCVTSGLPVDGILSNRVQRSTGGCPSGWTRYGSRCFVVYTHHVSMADAELTCITHHGNLASIHSGGEQSFISNLIHKKCQRNEQAWIGLYDAVQEGRWFWTDGSKVVFTYWTHGEPNNHRGREHCTIINWHGSRWNDVRCSDRKPFVCAKKL